MARKSWQCSYINCPCYRAIAIVTAIGKNISSNLQSLYTNYHRKCLLFFMKWWLLFLLKHLTAIDIAGGTTSFASVSTSKILLLNFFLLTTYSDEIKREISCVMYVNQTNFGSKVWQRNLYYRKKLQVKYFTGENIPIYGIYVTT